MTVTTIMSLLKVASLIRIQFFQYNVWISVKFLSPNKAFIDIFVIMEKFVLLKKSKPVLKKFSAFLCHPSFSNTSLDVQKKKKHYKDSYMVMDLA